LSIYFLISVLLPTVLGILRLLVSSKFIRADRFECGFDSFNVRVFPVSLRVFLCFVLFF